MVVFFVQFLGSSLFLICLVAFTFLLFFFLCLAPSWIFPMCHNKVLIRKKCLMMSKMLKMNHPIYYQMQRTIFVVP